MLTGDKLETAENIAEATKLLNPRKMTILKLASSEDVDQFCSDEAVFKNDKRILDK